MQTVYYKAVEYTGEDRVRQLRIIWFSQRVASSILQWHNRIHFNGALTRKVIILSDVLQAFTSANHTQTKGLVERQNKTLLVLLVVSFSRNSSWHCASMARLELMKAPGTTPQDPYLLYSPGARIKIRQ